MLIMRCCSRLRRSIRAARTLTYSEVNSDTVLGGDRQQGQYKAAYIHKAYSPGLVEKAESLAIDVSCAAGQLQTLPIRTHMAGMEH